MWDNADYGVLGSSESCAYGRWLATRFGEHNMITVSITVASFPNICNVGGRAQATLIPQVDSKEYLHTTPIYYSSFHFIFHHPNITPIFG